MRRIVTLCVLLASASALALADDFSGRLLDESCYAKEKAVAKCDATGATTSFALDVSGVIYKLDQEGNSKAEAAIKNRADRSMPGSKTAPAQVMAKVTGTANNGVITVETINVQ